MDCVLKPMEPSPEARSISQLQAPNQKKRCDICCELDYLFPVEESGEKKVLSHPRTGDRLIILEQTLGAYEISAGLGCPICRLLATVFDHFWPGRPREAKATLILWKDGSPELRSEDWPGVRLYTKQTLGREHGLPHVAVFPDISPSHSSPEAFEFLYQRLKECSSEHTSCLAKSPDGMPKRLIHIKNDHHATLVEATDGSEHANATYAALSYCWGGDQKFKSKKSNVSLLMEKGFPIASLPIVWQETIGLCRKLSFQYLWIDALCIIQDDEADWTQESTRMGTIYENAYLTIAPASSGSVDTPFLGSTPDPSRKPVEFLVLPASPGCPATTVYARKRPVSWHFGEGGEMRKDPWRLRGWTLQEEILSRRLIIFGAEEMQWRCRTTTACECHEDIFVYSNWPDELLKGYGQSSRETREHEMWTYWRSSVLGRYGHRQNTYPQDAFSAIAGLVQRVARATGWTYIAGMWKEHLLVGMCWHNTFLEGVDPFYRVYTAPTFSWASVNGLRTIHFRLWKDFKPDAAVVDVNIEPKHADAPFSALVDGWVVLRGRLALASLEYAHGKYCVVLDDSAQDNDVTARRKVFEIWPDTHIQAVAVATSSPEGHEDRALWTGSRASEAPSGSHIARLGAPPESQGCVVWMLPLGTFYRYWGDVEVQCVLVLGKSVRRPGAYERLGLVSTGYENGPQLKPMENGGWTETLTIV